MNSNALTISTNTTREKTGSLDSSASFLRSSVCAACGARGGAALEAMRRDGAAEWDDIVGAQEWDCRLELGAGRAASRSASASR